MALADGFQGRLGRPDEAHDLRVLQFAVVAQQPENGVGPVLSARQRRIAGAALLLEFGQAHLGDGERQTMAAIFFAGGDFLAGQLARGDRIVALDAGRHFAVGDAFDFKGVQFAKFSDLIEGQRRIFDQPDRGRFGHQRRFAHFSCLLSFEDAPPRPAPGRGSASKLQIMRE
jgi:hypothetical protein